MKIFNSAKWIWAKNSLDVDDYASFEDSFTSNCETLSLLISVDTTYALYINNKLVKFNQCSDYPYFKFYDEVEIEVNKGVNTFRIDVWHFGYKSSTYKVDTHGVIFEIKDYDKVIYSSNEKTPSRVMNEFHNGYKKIITNQLGFSYEYDSCVKKNALNESIVMDKPIDVFHKREINDIKLLDRESYEVLRTSPSILIDLKKETAGFIDLSFVSKKEQKLTICYGEHIIDGGVRRIIHDRDFSVEYHASVGENHFMNPLRRVAGRYIEVFYEDEIEFDYIGIRRVNYDHKIIEKHFKDPELDKIYQTCLYTLECCMHEHYEDCPWREQALYSLDSRNQMLCGYYTFEGFEYQRHNLLLISQDRTSSGLLNLCYPMDDTGLAIPMFSLFFIIQTFEYVKYSGDFEMLEIARPKIEEIVKVFLNRIDENHLIKYFEKPFWNFYEWVEESSGEEVFQEGPTTRDQYDLVINSMYIYAMKFYNKMYDKNIDTSKMVEAIKATFYDEKRGQFRVNTNTNKSSQLGNALAVLIGHRSKELIEKIKNCEDMIEASLSVKGFVYDAILTNGRKEKDFIISDIRKNYMKMINEGATTVYETIVGAEDFYGAASLCHGWSALPIYYLSNLLEGEE